MAPRVPALLAFVLAFFIAAGGAARAAPSTTQTWLVVSDIHLNPFVRGPIPALYGSDSDLTLFSSLLAEMKRTVPDPSVVLLPGDFLVHNFPRVVRAHRGAGTPEQAALRTMRLIAGDFNRAFPHALFAVALGNNDAPCGDYRSDDDDRYAAALARIWAPLTNRSGAAPDFVAGMQRGGYYTAALPLHVRLIALNTVLFSSEYRGACADRAPGAERELTWLRSALRAAPRGERNVVMMHVPPGYDAFTTQAAHGFVPWSFMTAHDGAQLVAALADPRARVAFAIAGHTHHFDFRLFDSVPILVFGSVSPVYRNNPSFYALHVGDGGVIRDIDVYAYDEWQEQWDAPRSFDAKWNVPRVDAATLRALHRRLGADPKLRRLWDLSSSGWPSNPALMWPTWGAHWRIAWCAQTVFDGGYARCAGIARRAGAARILGLMALLAVIAAFIAAVVFLIRRRSKVR
jgi:hypothetical protein